MAWEDVVNKVYKETGYVDRETRKREELRKAREEQNQNKNGSTSDSSKDSQKKDSFFGWLGKNATAGISQFNKGLFSSLDFILPTEILGKYDVVSKLNDY